MSIFVWDSCALSLGGLAYNELHHNYSVNITRDGRNSATRELMCDWDDAIALATLLRGGTAIVSGSPVFTNAAAHPQLANLRVASVQIIPVGASTGTNTWEQAKLTVSYDIPQFGGDAGSDPDTLIEERLGVTSANILMPKQKVRFINGNPLEEDIYTDARQIEYTITLYKQTSLPLIAISQVVNRVNDAAFKGLAAGEALYGGAEASRSINSEGDFEWTITHVFYISEYDIRTRWDPITKAYVEVELADSGAAGTGEKLIKAADFSTLGISVV